MPHLKRRNMPIKNQVRSITMEMPRQSFVFQSEPFYRTERMEFHRTMPSAGCPHRDSCVYEYHPSDMSSQKKDYQPLTQELNPVFLHFEFKILRGSAMTHNFHFNTCLVESALQPRQTSDTLPTRLCSDWLLWLPLYHRFEHCIDPRAT